MIEMVAGKGIDMGEVEGLVYQQYGLKIEVNSKEKLLSRGNICFGHDKETEYVIKKETIHTAQMIDELAHWAETADSALIRLPRFLKTKQGLYYAEEAGEAVTLQVKERAESLLIFKSDLAGVGEAIGEFHNLLSSFPASRVNESDFYRDFMFGEVPKAQTPERQRVIEQFYRAYTPDYSRLTKGVCHNDLNCGNILALGSHYLIIDFEHMKNGPVISDLGVFALEAWKTEEVEDYWDSLTCLLNGYLKKVPLSQYDKECILLFSLRYLYSDENYYTYLAKITGKCLAAEIALSRRKQETLLKALSLPR